jgi:hypothetical protein
MAGHQIILPGVEYHIGRGGTFGPWEKQEGYKGEGMTPEEIIQLIVEKIEEGDPEVLSRISLVMKNRLLHKKEDLKEIEALLKAQIKKK